MSPNLSSPDLIQASQTTITTPERGQLMQLLSHMGMNPSGRTRVVATLAPTEESEWDELDAPHQTA